MVKHFTATCVLVACAASAQGWDSKTLFARVEGSAAFPLGSPQSDRFGVGFDGLLSAGVGIGWLEPELTGLLLALPSRQGSEYSQTSVSGGPGVGLRVRLPFEILGTEPWVDANLFYLRTATLNRFGYSVAVGAQTSFGDALRFQLGPVLRFTQIIDPDQSSFDDRDAYLLTVGLSVQFGFPVSHSASTDTHDFEGAQP